jgi:hypothetical protein
VVFTRSIVNVLKLLVNSTKPRQLATVVFNLEVSHSSLDTLHTFLVVSRNLS